MTAAPELVVARTLFGLGYNAAEVRETVVRRFPEADVDDVVQEARRDVANLDLDLAQSEEDEQRAAREAEHNLSKSNEPEA